MILVPSPQGKGELTASSLSHLHHQVIINEYGFVLVNDTMTFKNELVNPATLPTIKVTFPPEYLGHIGPHEVGAPTPISVTKEGTELTLSPDQDYELSPGASITIHLRSYLLKLLAPAGTYNYNAVIPLFPSFNLPIDTADVDIVLPSRSELITPPEGFKQTTGTVWKRSFTNVSEGYSLVKGVLVGTQEGADLTLLDFPEGRREITVSSQGGITVSESITMVHYGERETSSIGLNLLNTDLRRITITPPLKNPYEVPIIDGKVNLGTSLKKGEKYVLSIEYPVPFSKYAEIKDGTIKLSIPLRPPIDGVIEKFSVMVSHPPALLIQGSGEVAGFAASPLSKDLKVTLRPGVAWASTDILPIATPVFILIFIALFMIRRPVPEGEAREVVGRVGEFTKALEDRSSATKALIDAYRKRQADQISKREFEEARKVLRGRRNRALSKIGTLRPQIISQKPSLRGFLDDVSHATREYDRCANDLINLYEQLFARRIPSRTFERLLSSYRKRFDDLDGRLSFALDALRHEAE